MQVLENDQSSKMLITHYQFISAILNENLNIPNRWYYPNNTFHLQAKINIMVII